MILVFLTNLHFKWFMISTQKLNSRQKTYTMQWKTLNMNIIANITQCDNVEVKRKETRKLKILLFKL